MPRDFGADEPVRRIITTVNSALAKLDDGNPTRYLDFLQPGSKGNRACAAAMQPLVLQMMNAECAK